LIFSIKLFKIEVIPLIVFSSGQTSLFNFWSKLT
jgi:hypothetical protein